MEYKNCTSWKYQKTERFGGNPTDGRVYSDEGISPTICTHSGPMIFKKSAHKKVNTFGMLAINGFDDTDFTERKLQESVTRNCINKPEIPLL